VTLNRGGYYLQGLSCLHAWAPFVIVTSSAEADADLDVEAH
jgi:hypothetical protein